MFVNEARKLLGATHAVVVVFERSIARVAAHSSDHVSGEFLRNVNPSHPRNAEWFARLLRGEPELNPDVTLAPSSETDGYYAAAGLRTVMRAPIFGSAGAVTGSITIGSPAAYAWSERELGVLCELSAALGLVVERAELLAAAEQQQQRTRAVLDILAALGPRDTIEEVAQPVAEALRAMFGAAHCAVSTLDGDHVSVVGVDSTLADWELGARTPLPALFEQVMRDGFHVDGDVITGGHNDGPITAFLGTRGMRSALRVRIGTADDPQGLVAVGATLANHFTEADARQLQQIVQPLAVVASYFRDKREAERRTMRLEYTNRILTRLSAGGTAEHLAAGFLAECRLLFDCPHALAAEFDVANGVARALAIDSDMLPYDPALTMPLAGLGVAGLLQQPTPQLVTDYSATEVTNELQQGLIDAGLLSAIAPR